LPHRQGPRYPAKSETFVRPTKSYASLAGNSAQSLRQHKSEHLRRKAFCYFYQDREGDPNLGATLAPWLLSPRSKSAFDLGGEYLAAAGLAQQEMTPRELADPAYCGNRQSLKTSKRAPGGSDRCFVRAPCHCPKGLPRLQQSPGCSSCTNSRPGSNRQGKAWNAV
jgi:hypothetical protein